MRRSFYEYLMTERDPYKKDDITQFANAAELDDTFPKHTDDYHKISQYLEMNGQYLPSMTVFDDAWQKYEETNEEL